MKRVEMNADGLVELQALEAEGMFGGGRPLSLHNTDSVDDR